MTEITLPGPAPAPVLDEPVAPPEEQGAGGPRIPLAGEGRPRNRGRRAALLILLSILLGIFLVIAGWYLITRKPLTQMPLPGLTTEQIPHYSFSAYGATAPTGIAVSADGSRIYATQTEGGAAVIAFDGSGNPIATMTFPANTGTEHVPVYLAVNPTNGDVYVSDRPTASIYVFSADGVYRRTFDPGPALRDWQPLGLAFDQKGDLFVTSLGSPYQAVQEFGADGTFVRTLGEPGEFSFANGVATDSQGNVYVADSNNGRLFVYDSTGAEVAVVQRGSRAGELGMPRGLAVDDQNRVYVADVTTQGIQIYHGFSRGDTSLKFIGTAGTQGAGDGQFMFPNSVAVDGRGRLYVADWRNNRVQVWSY